MAQVKKLNTGGSVQKYKYGKDIRNGVTYDVDEEYMRQLDEYLSKADPEMQNDLAQARNNLMNGKTVTSDSFKNQIDANSMDLTERQENRASKDYNAFKAGWRGATNNRQHRINKAIQYWNNFKYVKPEEKKEEPEDNRTKLTYGQHAFNYTKDGDNYAYINGPGNASAMEYLSSFKKYFDTADKKTYNVSGWANNDTLDGLNAWWSALENPEQYWTGLLDDIKNGRELSTDELEALKVMGIGYNRGTAVSTDPDSENTELSPEEKKRKEKFDKAGWAYNEWKDRGELGDDGSFILNADALGRYETGNYRFNDYWERDYANPNEMWRRGYVQLGDRLYKETDAGKEGSTLYNYLRQKGGFYDLVSSGDYATSDSKLKWLWGNSYYQDHDDTYLGDFYKGIQYDPTANLNQTGTTWKNGTLDPEHQIVRYINMLEGEVDDFGFRIPQLGIVDKYGRTIAKGLSEDEFTNLYEGGGSEVKKAEQNLKRTKRTSADPENPYYNYYTVSVGSADSPLYKFHLNQNYNELDPKSVYAVMELGELLNNKTLGKNLGVNVPKSVVEIMSDVRFREAIDKDPRFQKKMLNTIMSLTGSDWQDIFRGNFNRYKELAKKVGMSEEEIKPIIDYFYKNGSNEWYNGAAWERKRDYTSVLPGAYKQGGILKAQQGRILNAGSKDNDTSLKTSGETVKHTEHGAVPGSDKLSRADIAELVSVGGDVIGTVAGLFGPVGDIVGSGIGLAASATQLGADISRDGFQLRDLGRFGLNAGLDAVGLLPFLGDAARVAKVASGVKKVSKVLSPLFIGIGAVTAADSVGKVVNGEKLTVQDWSNLAAGFLALTNAGVLGTQRFNKAKIDSLASKMGTDVKMPDYKAEIDKSTITITAKDFADNINGKSKEQVTKFLIQKAKEAGVADNKMPKDIIKHFGLKSTGVGKWGKVSDPNLPTTQPEKSTFRSFFSNIDKSLDKAATDGRLQKLVDSFNSKRTVINGAGVDVIRVESPEIKNGLSRTLASIASDRGLNVQLTPKSKTRYTRISQLPAGEYAYVHNPKTKEAVLAEVTQNINNLPIQSRVIAESLNTTGVRAKLMPTGPGQQALPNPKTRLRNARNRFRINRELSNISEQELAAAGMMTAPTHTQMLHSLTKGAGQARYTADVTDIDTAIKDTDFSAYNLWKKYPELYGRLTGYRKALQNVNSEASFKKLVDNMRNDIEFQLAMQENPGLLRQDMLDAAARAGLMGSSRKNLVKGMTFKKGGILKAQNGLNMDKVRKDLLDHTLSDLDKDLRISPFGVSTKASTGIETAMQNEQNRAIGSIKGRQIPSMLGQQPRGFNLNLEGMVNPMLSGIRYIDSIRTNQRILDEKAKGLKEATLAKYRSPMQFVPSRNTLNAGNPYYEQARRTIQSLPTVNSDYLAQAALDKMNKDQANAIKAQGDLAMAQQHSENLARLRQEKQAQMQHEWEVDNYNKDLKSAELAGLSDLKAGTMLGNYQSRQNLLGQIQTEWDQNRQLYNNISSAAAQNEARNKAYDWYQGQIKSHFGTTPIDMNNPAHYEFVTNAQRQVSDRIANAGYQSQASNLSSYWRNKLNPLISAKHGTKLRSTEDQIKINRHKSVDQNWVNSSKAVNKAIEKLNDRVHDILMKILSDEV